MTRPSISSNNYDTCSIDEWADNFWWVYKYQDRERTPPEIWLMATYDASQAGRAIREGNFSAAIPRLAHTFCWVASFVKRISIDNKDFPQFADSRFAQLSDIVWYKYPNACPACGERTCDCVAIRGRFTSVEDWKEERKRVWLKVIPEYREQRLELRRLDDWGTMFSSIYRAVHTNLRFEEIGFHFLEEVGEVAEAVVLLSDPGLLDKVQAELRETLYTEIADTISWILCLVNKINHQFEDSQVISQIQGILEGTEDTGQGWQLTLSNMLWYTYKLEDADFIGCPACKSPVCDPQNCQPIRERKGY